jgi:hypothetical protein
MAMPYLGINDEVQPLITISPRVTDKAGNDHEVPAQHPNQTLVEVHKAHIITAAREIFKDPMLIYCLDSQYYATKVITDARYFVGKAHVAGKYVREVFDCDDFSRAFKENMVLQGYTAVGRVVDFAGGHSYNAIAVAGTDDIVRLWLVEPQTGHIFTFPDTRKKPYLGNGKGYIEF